MRREELYLGDIMQAADALRQFLADVRREDFLLDDLLRSAVLQKLTIIGEAVACLPRRLRERHPEIEWQDIVGFRNIAVHAYFSIDWDLVWMAAMRDAPILRSQVAGILEREYSGPSLSEDVSDA
ncbi:MAG: DUF86 domain-containing protein [Chloroflexota bacterium]|nr:MAG: DUF86 domain-containing protein [Chloroflexota bacterium]